VYPVRTQARALIVEDGRALLIRVDARGHVRWVLPGGGQDAGETLVQTVARECREELGIDVEVGRLAYVREFVPGNHPRPRHLFDPQSIDVVFDCRRVGGEPHLAAGADREAREVSWVPIDEAIRLPLYPAALARWLEGHPTAGAAYLGDSL
jgi:8-oxo-dGTP pyrophosphatase MutT (NUDIX family)